MDIETIRAAYPGYSDDELASAIQSVHYRDYSVGDVKKALGIKPPSLGQQFGSGLKRSFQELPGLAAGVGAFAADALGATETRDKLLGYAQDRQQALAKEHVNDAASFSDAWDGKTSWMDFLANASGYVAGQALQSLMTGGIGAGAARLLASRGAAQLMEGAAAKAIAAGATEEAAKQASIEALKQATSRAISRGAVAGAGAHNFGMELGSIYPDAVEQAKKEGRNELDAGDMFRVFASASLAAGVDTAGEAIMASRVFKGSGSGAGSVVGRALREVPAGMVREAGTEAVQTAIEHYGAGQPIADEKGLRDIIDSAAIGAVGGGMGGSMASVRAKPKPDLGAAKTVSEMIEAAHEIAFPTGDDLASLLPQPKKPELTAELGAAPPPVAPPEGSIEFESPTPTPDRLADRMAGDLQLAPQQSLPWQPAPPVPAATADAIANADAVVPPVERAPRQRVEPVEMQPVQPAAPADPVLGFVDQMRQVNTPQARAFVQDFNAGRITRHRRPP